LKWLHEGKINDASFVEILKQRNSRVENASIKKSKVPDAWDDTPNNLSKNDLQSVISRISVFPFLCNYQKKNRCEILSMKKQESNALAAQIASLWKETALIKDVEITHLNLNDKTIEGVRVKGKPAFSVQYHPEANPSPHDSRYLFDQFVEMITTSPVEMV